jgi:hypothetical protein
MDYSKRTAALAELILIFPAAVFMTALFVRTLQPLQFEPAHTAQRIVMWYSSQPWTLWLLLIALPLTVLVTGCATLIRTWTNGVELRQAARQPLAATCPQVPTFIVAAATLASAAVLAIVAVHMLAN